MWRRRAGAVSLAAIAALLVASCGGFSETDEGSAGIDALGHVHGLGINPADGDLYAASHYGVFRLPSEGEPERIADRWQDTMGFTVVGPDRFLGSGHPDMREADLPPLLGLIESDDAADTWSSISLQGRADFHALEADEERIVGYDASTGGLLLSKSGERWRTLARDELIDLALSPANPDLVMATTSQARLVSYSLTNGSLQPPTNAPPLVFIDWPTPELFVGLGTDGNLYVSRDQSTTWLRAEGPPGAPQALDVTAEAWHVATSTGIYRSTDDGRSWTQLA